MKQQTPTDRDLLAKLAQLRIECDLSFRAMGEMLGFTERHAHRLLSEPPAQLNLRARYKVEQAIVRLLAQRASSSQAEASR